MRSFLFIAAGAHLLLLTGFFVGVNAGGDKKNKGSDDPTPAEEKKPEVKQLTTDEEILKRAEMRSDSASLLKFFKDRTLPEDQRQAIQQMVHKLGSSDYRVREKAVGELTSRGVAVLEVLRATHSELTDLERMRRIEHAMHQIREKDASPETIAAAIRALETRKPAGLTETLIGYLPVTDNESVIEEIRLALASSALKDKRAEATLSQALSDRAPSRRAAAAEALAKVAYADHKAPLRKMLQDPDPLVRFRVAQALIVARQADAVPTAIDSLPDLPINTAWQAEDLLLRVAGGLAPPTVAMGNDKKSREKCRQAWRIWWNEKRQKIDLTRFEEVPKLLGRTLVVLLDQDKVVELAPDNYPLWEIQSLVFPLDAQLLSEDRVLVAEYRANKVTERTSAGTLRWQHAVMGPLMAQRLPDGNTFIATDAQFIEVTKDGTEVLNVVLSQEGRTIMKAMKLPSGEIVCMTVDGRIVRFNAKGQELNSFPINLGMHLFGGRIHILPSGRVLVPHNAEGKVSEYDSRGNIIWEVPFEQPIAATRIPNGNTLITSMNPAVGAVEIDRAGNAVWSFRDTTRVTRAIRH